MQRRARPARDVDQLGDCVEQAVPLVAHVGDERSADRCRLLGDGDQLVRRSVRARQVDEPEREHAGSRLEPEAHLAAHLDELFACRGHLAASEHELAHCAVADGGDERERGACRVERIEVLGHRRPRPRLRAAALERPQVRLAPGAALRPNRCGSEPVGVDHLGREALGELRRQERVVERDQRRVRVHVDEARAEHQPTSVDDLARLRHAVILVTIRHKDDLAGAGADVAFERRRVARVDGRSADEEVERRHLTLPRAVCGSRRPSPPCRGRSRRAGARSRDARPVPPRGRRRR